MGCIFWTFQVNTGPSSSESKGFDVNSNLKFLDLKSPKLELLPGLNCRNNVVLHCSRRVTLQEDSYRPSSLVRLNQSIVYLATWHLSWICLQYIVQPYCKVPRLSAAVWTLISIMYAKKFSLLWCALHFGLFMSPFVSLLEHSLFYRFQCHRDLFRMCERDKTIFSDIKFVFLLLRFLGLLHIRHYFIQWKMIS